MNSLVVYMERILTENLTINSCCIVTLGFHLTKQNWFFFLFLLYRVQEIEVTVIIALKRILFTPLYVVLSKTFDRNYVGFGLLRVSSRFLILLIIDPLGRPTSSLVSGLLVIFLLANWAIGEWAGSPRKLNGSYRKRISQLSKLNHSWPINKFSYISNFVFLRLDCTRQNKANHV